ncbi:MAG: exodeoxyribonuclease III [Bacteroidales bacterium]|nr:exodeoxyribonuclease III [Bacteroidales bacterium]MCF8403576.1 exodeoxyribonuclease III [Bacteroidales bacterium]
MKIITYNVNGIRAAITKGFPEWLKSTDADIVCIQETKAQPDQIPSEIFEEMGYQVYIHSAEKRGYSGVAILSKLQPKHIEYGMGVEKYDREGRVIRADYEGFSVISVYHPSGSSGDERQAFKMLWLEDFYVYIEKLKKKIPHLVISGDYNICHRPIDIHDPVRNAKNSGFLPEEREWLGKFIDSGFIDSFRYFNKEPHHYSWWSYRANARAKNLGWRIDYNMVAVPLEDKLIRAVILPQAKHSDHCPVVVEME